jgi:hypothetical protein
MSDDVVKVDIKDPGNWRFPFGAAQVLTHSRDVVDAFGRPLGFVIIMTALMPGMAASVGTVVAVSRALGRVLG